MATNDNPYRIPVPQYAQPMAGRVPVSANTLTMPAQPQGAASPQQTSLFNALMNGLSGGPSNAAGVPASNLGGLIGALLNNPDLAKQVGGFASQNYTPNMPAYQRVDFSANAGPGGLLQMTNWGDNGGLLAPTMAPGVKGGSR